MSGAYANTKSAAHLRRLTGLLIVAAAISAFGRPAFAQSQDADGWFSATDRRTKTFFVTTIEKITDARKWDSPNYFAAFAKEMGWDTRDISHYSGRMQYISKASTYFERQSRRAYSDMIDRMQAEGYTVVIIPLPKPIPLAVKRARAKEY